MSGKTNIPIIAVTCSQMHTSSGTLAQCVNVPYVEAVKRYGGLPLLLPTGLSEQATNAVVAAVDGVLFTGGVDIDPSRYGEERQPYCDVSSLDRDGSEIQLMNAALTADKPILAICRGIQVLNVACGGSLYQDIASVIPQAIEHRTGSKKQPVHTVRLAENSLIATVIGEPEIGVNSRHHQAINSLGDGLTPVAWSPDGIIEGLENKSRRFCLGVQWHPEDMTPDAAHAAKLFLSFIRAASSTN